MKADSLKLNLQFTGGKITWECTSGMSEISNLVNVDGVRYENQLQKVGEILPQNAEKIRCSGAKMVNYSRTQKPRGG
jgi:hypothetical protein